MKTKAILRLEATHTLMALDIRRREEAALAAFSLLTSHLKDTPKTILSFASKPLEVNLWPFNTWLLKHHRLCLPKMENDTLIPYQVESLEELSLSKYGIKEPNSSICTKIPTDEIDLVLVPGLCFDLSLHRVGYGKGLFDKLLSQMPHAIKWGIGFKEQKISKIPKKPHDIPVDNLFLF